MAVAAGLVSQGTREKRLADARGTRQQAGRVAAQRPFAKPGATRLTHRVRLVTSTSCSRIFARARRRSCRSSAAIAASTGRRRIVLASTSTSPTSNRLCSGMRTALRTCCLVRTPQSSQRGSRRRCGAANACSFQPSYRSTWSQQPVALRPSCRCCRSESPMVGSVRMVRDSAYISNGCSVCAGQRIRELMRHRVIGSG